MTAAVSQPRTPTHDAPPPRLLLLADDITGACDSAVAFARPGLPARLLLRPDTEPASITALCTATRNHVDAHAAATLRHTLRSLPTRWQRESLFFLKLDSAGRGPIGATLLAAAEALQPDLTLLAPAFPGLGRSVVDGTLRVTDVAGQRTQISLPGLFPAASQHRIALIPTGSAATLRHALRADIDAGRDLLLCDSASAEDLQALTDAALALRRRTLWAGSGGLARALAHALSPQPLAAPTQPLPPGRTLVRRTLVRRTLVRRTLILCGTHHPVTRLQLAALQAQLAASPEPQTQLVQLDWQHTTAADIRALFRQHRPATLLIIGGDTAAFVLDALDAAALDLCDELSPGIPHGVIVDGLADGCRLITKSGGFGDEHALCHVLQLCSGAAA